MSDQRFQISRDSEALFITLVAARRLPVFKTDAVKLITFNAIDEARNSSGFMLFAYVIMPDHLHLLTSNPESSATVLRYIKRITGKRVVTYLAHQCSTCFSLS